MYLHTGSLLRQIRLSYKKKQKEMACLFGVSRGTYSSWESRYKYKFLPEKVFRKLPFIVGILNSSKYKNVYILQKPLPKKTKIKIFVEKESIWKRILRWIKN